MTEAQFKKAIENGDLLRVANLNHQVRWALTERADEGSKARKQPLKLRNGLFATDKVLFVAYSDGQTAMFAMPLAISCDEGSLVPSVNNKLFLGYAVPTGATKAQALAYVNDNPHLLKPFYGGAQ